LSRTVRREESLTRLIALGVALAMVCGVGLLLSRTRIGLGMRALASDRNISAAIGVRVVQIDSFAWLINGMFAGIAGILLANLNRLDPGCLTFSSYRRSPLRSWAACRHCRAPSSAEWSPA
jgi:branched-subunit amino acid ABC-type transport system permease component